MDALYRDYILDHYKNPRNFGELEPHDLEFHDVNPLCGDELGVHVKVEDGPGRPLGRSFRVRLWPNLVFLKDGHVVRQLARPAASDLREAFEALVSTT